MIKVEKVDNQTYKLIIDVRPIGVVLYISKEDLYDLYSTLKKEFD